MRRALALVALLLLAAPLATAQDPPGGQTLLDALTGNGQPPRRDPPPAAAPAPKAAPAPHAPPAAPPSDDGRRGGGWAPPALAPVVAASLAPAFLGLGLMGLALVAILGVAVLLARRAQRPRHRKAPRKSFERGRAEALRRRPLGLEEALRQLENAPIGEVLSAKETAPGRVVVAVKRRRGHACERVGGHLAGLFESAWATDVRVAHESCGGRWRRAPCTFVVTRGGGGGARGGRVSAGGPRAGAASIRG